MRPALPLSLLIAALSAACSDEACSPCHQGANNVVYHEAYTTHGSQCISYDYNNRRCNFSIPTSTYHPARCEVWFQCFETCGTIDRGKLEAHPKHPTIKAPPTVDPRCAMMEWDR